MYCIYKKIAVFFTILELIMSSNFQLKSEKQSSEKLISKLAFLKENFLFREFHHIFLEKFFNCEKNRSRFFDLLLPTRYN